MTLLEADDAVHVGHRVDARIPVVEEACQGRREVLVDVVDFLVDMYLSGVVVVAEDAEGVGFQRGAEVEGVELDGFGDDEFGWRAIFGALLAIREEYIDGVIEEALTDLLASI